MNLIKRYKLKTKFRRLFGLGSGKDDFDWSVYTDHYRQELIDLEKDFTLSLSPGDYVFADGQLRRANAHKPLVANSRLIYETVLQLNRQPVLEAGCGGGDHLHNLLTLSPTLDIRGIDRSQRQLDLLAKRHPGLSVRTRCGILTDPALSIGDFPRPEVIYTNAVIMHIKEGNGHLIALQNIFRLATDVVILIENWGAHPFLDDIKTLHQQGALPWPKLHFYYRESPELKRPLAMVISREPLPFPVLEDYRILLPEDSRPSQK